MSGFLCRTFNNRVIYQQFTGLLDQNNTEIYEGDIIEYKHPEFFSLQRGQIVFNNGMFIINNNVIPKYEHLRNLMLYFFNKNGKVIGNIFDNPELISW